MNEDYLIDYLYEIDIIRFFLFTNAIINNLTVFQFGKKAVNVS